MNAEIERGRQDAIRHLSESDIVRVKRSELVKMRALMENFLAMNTRDLEIVEPCVIERRKLVRNYEDLEYVFGYLKGLT